MQGPGYSQYVQDPGYSQYVQDPGYSQYVQGPGYSQYVQGPGYSQYIQDPGYSQYVHDLVTVIMYRTLVTGSVCTGLGFWVSKCTGSWLQGEYEQDPGYRSV